MSSFSMVASSKWIQACEFNFSACPPSEVFQYGLPLFNAFHHLEILLPRSERSNVAFGFLTKHALKSACYQVCVFPGSAFVRELVS